MQFLVFNEFEKPVDAMRQSVTLLPKGIPKDSVSNCAHHADGTAVSISLMRTLEDVPHVHWFPPEPLLKPFPKALKNLIWGECSTRCDH
jgi:hypothetical protein